MKRQKDRLTRSIAITPFSDHRIACPVCNLAPMKFSESSKGFVCEVCSHVMEEGKVKDAMPKPKLTADGGSPFAVSKDPKQKKGKGEDDMPANARLVQEWEGDAA